MSLRVLLEVEIHVLPTYEFNEVPAISRGFVTDDPPPQK